MTDDQTVGLSSSLVKHDEVGKAVSLTNLNQVFHHVTTPVHSQGVRQDQLELLLESNKALRRISASGNE